LGSSDTSLKQNNNFKKKISDVDTMNKKESEIWKAIEELQNNQFSDTCAIGALKLKIAALSLPLVYRAYNSEEILNFLEPFMEKLLIIAEKILRSEINPLDGTLEAAHLMRRIEEEANKKGFPVFGKL